MRRIVHVIIEAAAFMSEKRRMLKVNECCSQGIMMTYNRIENEMKHKKKTSICNVYV